MLLGRGAQRMEMSQWHVRGMRKCVLSVFACSVCVCWVMSEHLHYTCTCAHAQHLQGFSSSPLKCCRQEWISCFFNVLHLQKPSCCESWRWFKCALIPLDHWLHRPTDNRLYQIHTFLLKWFYYCMWCIVCRKYICDLLDFKTYVHCTIAY